eukprot:gene20437-7434_t
MRQEDYVTQEEMNYTELREDKGDIIATFDSREVQDIQWGAKRKPLRSQKSMEDHSPSSPTFEAFEGFLDEGTFGEESEEGEEDDAMMMLGAAHSIESVTSGIWASRRMTRLHEIVKIAPGAEICKVKTE